jgi:fructoselysine-6-P-deglycase FrlB-like protein
LFLFDGEGDLMIAARAGSPLAIGHGEGEMFVGSDAIALAPMTDRVTYLEEGDIAVVTRAGVSITDAEGRLANRAVTQIAIDSARVDKGGHRHFMAKEIAEQPMVIGNALRHFLSDDGNEIVLPEGAPDFTGVERIVLVACGTAYYACLTAKYWFEQLARIPVEVDIASEFRYREPPIAPGTLAIFVSQSGETADTLAALRYCCHRAERLLAVINIETSSIARESDVALPILAGAEIGVASTKAFTCQLTVLLLLALKAARARGEMGADRLADLLSALRGLPATLNTAMEIDAGIREVARDLAGAQSALFLGRGLMYPLALEGALKLKEISYIHAEAYASGELKHGPIALIDETMPVIVMAPCDALFEKTVSNMQEVMARGGRQGRGGGGRGHVSGGYDADGRSGSGANPLRIARAAHRLSHGHRQGHGRGSAAQSGEIGDGGITASAPRRDAQFRQRRKRKPERLIGTKRQAAARARRARDGNEIERDRTPRGRVAHGAAHRDRYERRAHPEPRLAHIAKRSDCGCRQAGAGRLRGDGRLIALDHSHVRRRGSGSGRRGARPDQGAAAEKDEQK